MEYRLFLVAVAVLAGLSAALLARAWWRQGGRKAWRWYTLYCIWFWPLPLVPRYIGISDDWRRRAAEHREAKGNSRVARHERRRTPHVVPVAWGPYWLIARLERLCIRLGGPLLLNERGNTHA